MSHLIISILLSMGIQFTIKDSGKVEISSRDYARLEATEEFQSNPIQPSESIIISDGVDPNSDSNSHE